MGVVNLRQILKLNQKIVLLLSLGTMSRKIYSCSPLRGPLSPAALWSFQVWEFSVIQWCNNLSSEWKAGPWTDFEPLSSPRKSSQVCTMIWVVIYKPTSTASAGIVHWCYRSQAFFTNVWLISSTGDHFSCGAMGTSTLSFHLCVYRSVSSKLWNLRCFFFILESTCTEMYL